jgi:hypothetical protein
VKLAKSTSSIGRWPSRSVFMGGTVGISVLLCSPWALGARVFAFARRRILEVVFWREKRHFLGIGHRDLTSLTEIVWSPGKCRQTSPTRKWT